MIKKTRQACTDNQVVDDLITATVHSESEDRNMGDKEKKIIKCVVVGDGAVGKTAMMLSYMTSTIPTQYQPTVVDTFSVNITVEEEEYTLELFDTAGQEDFETLRRLAYRDCDILVIVFSRVHKDSLDNVRTKWIKDKKQHMDKAKV